MEYIVFMDELITQQDPFSALADPRRRELLAQLAERQMSVNDLVSLTGWKQPQVSKQLAVLKAAGLVVDSKLGRQRLYRARLDALQPVMQWIQRLDQRWQQQFDQLDAYLNQQSEQGAQE